MTDRGQTIHDYLLGVVVVLLTIAGVFAFFPEVFIPFQEPVENEDRELAEELANELVEVNSTMQGKRTVNITGLERTVTDPDGLGRLVNRSGVPDWKQINVTVQDRTGAPLVRGDTSDTGSIFRTDSSGPPATVIRTVQARNTTHPCAESCQLVVRVWEG